MLKIKLAKWEKLVQALFLSLLLYDICWLVQLTLHKSLKKSYGRLFIINFKE